MHLIMMIKVISLNDLIDGLSKYNLNMDIEKLISILLQKIKLSNIYFYKKE